MIRERSQERIAPKTLASFVAWLDAAPDGTLLTATSLSAMLTAFVADETSTSDVAPIATPASSWRERLWLCDAETRLGVREAAEACGRPRSWIYRHTAAGTIPHKKHDGELVFLAGELRAWLHQHEETIVPPRLALHGRAS